MPEPIDVVEALLFASDTPVEAERIQEVLDLESPAVARELVADLRARLEEQGRALQVMEVAGGFRLVTRPEIAPWLVKLARTRTRSRLSRPSLETLAIIGYRQPVSRPEVDAIRGVNSEAVLDNLLERRMIRIAGRKDSPGRPFLYETTREFLVAFGLRDLGDLPKVDGELVVPELAQSAAAQLPDPDVEAATGPGAGEGKVAAAADSAEQDPGSGGDRVTASS
jgi:segregation and condensation protein B